MMCLQQQFLSSIFVSLKKRQRKKTIGLPLSRGWGLSSYTWKEQGSSLMLPAIVWPETNWNFWSFKHGVIHQLQPLDKSSRENLCCVCKSFRTSQFPFFLVFIFSLPIFMPFILPFFPPFFPGLPSSLPLFIPLSSYTSHCLHSFMWRFGSCGRVGADALTEVTPNRLETSSML